MDISSGSFPPNGEDAQWIIDGSDQTFMQDVVEASKHSLVLVDFWAPWCGPCKTLIPSLEKVVNQANGEVRMVKINIDENQGVAGQLGVRSVPTVFAFKDGQPVDGFQGAIPESQIVEFIKKAGAGGALEQIEQALAAAAQAFQDGELDQSAAIYAQILQAMPDNVDAMVGMARCFVAKGEYDRAKEVIALIPEESQKMPQVKSVLTAIELSDDGGSTDDASSDLQAKLSVNPDDFEAKFNLAKSLSAKGNHQDAANQLLEILEKDLDWNEGAAKEQLLKIFEAAGPTAEVSKSGRRRLSSLLFN
ncbi:thioredoxin [Hirschia baltica]|uniref:Thioredoxin n=1 Tax=Hirschia baltica (strain ATCC 49814 / DSM 5838 / IFAM 1418) TaxID=582402 RepID=C6XKC7_HIRBI|nr:thioredoxin [Hirschia baltica]ACT57725.1 thioredoxin [Hirschia baltica ATCC 49814]